MRHTGTKWFAFLVAAGLALSCGGEDGVDGVPGGAGQDGTSCTVADNADGSKTITCGATTVTIAGGADGQDGANGQDGTSCTVADNADGSKTVTCGATAVTIADGADGQDGANGQDGTSCTVTDAGDGSKTVTCGATTVTITDGTDGQDGQDGQDGASCTVADNGDGSKTVTCGATTVLVTDGIDGQDGASAAVSNAMCLTAECHGDPDLTKTIVTPTGGNETVPLYVNEALYAATVHGDQKCAGCHNDINAIGGAHAPVAKTYGGWARFSASQQVEAFATHEVVRTRNYYTAAARSCPTCHTEHAGYEYSAHAVTPKQRSAHIDVELSAIATTEEGKATTIGEDYEVGNCNRCHASCATCHFKTKISRKNASAAHITDFWDQVQATDTAPGFNANMSEYQMDWTGNVASHEFRSKSYFADDSEGVCEACHTGFQRPTSNAYYWLDKSAGTWAKVKATNVKRHPQASELAISGSTTLSPSTGGENAAHAAFVCADCHGTASQELGAAGNIHGLPGLAYKWSEAGDVQCVSCHADYVHDEGVVDLHVNGGFTNGTRVACIGCHTYGLARDFEIATTGTSDSHEVFIDPVTLEVRPVVKKNGHAIAWYSHNWQTLEPGTGRTDPVGGCARKCHYEGNVVGAGF